MKERFREQKPNLKEIFYALADEDTTTDWDRQILDKADLLDIQRVNEVLLRGLPLSEAGIEIDYLMEDVK